MPVSLFCSVLAVFTTVLIYSLVTWRLNYIRFRNTQNRFRLYGVRDELVGLVASGMLKEDDEIFQTYYSLINSVVRHQAKLTFSSFVSSISKQSKDTKTEEFVKKLKKGLKDRGKETTTVVEHFYMAVRDIVIENSVSIRTLVKVERTFSPIVKWVIAVWTLAIPMCPEYARSRVDAYDLYRSSEFVLANV